MRSKRLSRKTLLAVVLTGLVLALVALLFANPGHSIPNSTAFSYSTPPDTIIPVAATPSPHAYGLPKHLRIPVINVDAPVIEVGIAADGTMDVPKNPTDTGWYKLGKHPGEVGSAVIAGHYGTWLNGKGSVFDSLHKLHQGDRVFVEDDLGVTTTFVVREIKNYDPNADASAVFNSTDGKAHLNLITCEGSWNDTTKSYSKRLVVFTDKQ